MEETPRPLSELVQKTYLIRHRRREDKEAERDAILERIKRKEVYEAEKDKVLVAERGVLHALEFCFNVDHAYKTVLFTVKKEANNDKEIGQVAWNFCNDRWVCVCMYVCVSRLLRRPSMLVQHRRLDTPAEFINQPLWLRALLHPQRLRSVVVATGLEHIQTSQGPPSRRDD